MPIEQKLRKIIEGSKSLISEDMAIRFILLIGSQATGKESPMSDIDIAVCVDPKENRKNSFQIQVDLGTLLGNELRRDDIDIVILNDATPSFRFEAIRNGQVIFMQDEGEYEDYVVRTLSEYYDSSYFLNRQFQYVRSSLQGDSK